MSGVPTHHHHHPSAAARQRAPQSPHPPPPSHLNPTATTPRLQPPHRHPSYARYYRPPPPIHHHPPPPPPIHPAPPPPPPSAPPPPQSQSASVQPPPPPMSSNSIVPSPLPLHQLQSAPLSHSAMAPPPPLAALPQPHPHTPVLGWTPRTRHAPHSGTPRGVHHSVHPPPVGSTVGVGPPPHPSPVTLSASPHALKSSPRLKLKTGAIVKPSPKSSTLSSVTLAAAPPLNSSNTPSWLKGSYRPQITANAALTGQAAVDAWCKDRLDQIKAIVEGRTDVKPSESMRDLKKLMVDLESRSVNDEMTLIRSIRRERWKARERQRKALADVNRAMREIKRIELHTAQVDGKIARLRGYVRFIESGWVDEDALKVPEKKKVKIEKPGDGGLSSSAASTSANAKAASTAIVGNTAKRGSGGGGDGGEGSNGNRNGMDISR